MLPRALVYLMLSVACIYTNAIAQSIPNYVPQNGLLGWWPFNGNATDESGNGNNGVVNGATLALDRFGVANKAYRFNGVSDIILISNPAGVSPSSALSVTCWFNISNPASFEHLVCKRLFTSLYPFNSYVLVSQFTNERYRASLTINPSSEFLIDGSNLLPSNTWHFLAMTYDGNFMRYYENGILVDSIVTTGIIQYSNLPLYFGGSGVANQSIIGRLDDIGVWNRALSTCEIEALYSAQLDTIGSGLNLFVDFNLSSCSTDTYHIFSLSGPVLWSNGDFGISTIVNSQGWIGARKEESCKILIDSIFVGHTFVAPIINIDQELSDCGSNTYVLRSQNGIVQWSTGQISNSITVTAPATVYALSFDFCKYSSDTIYLDTSFSTLKPTIDVTPELSDCLSNTFVINSQHGIVEWNTGEVSRSITVKAPAQVYAFTNDSCRLASDTIYLESTKSILFPNVITVNFDGLNDYLSFDEITNTEDYELILLNRWGREVYKSYSPTEQFFANNVAAGIYYYSLTYRDCKGVLAKYVGPLSVFK